jgi:hypothetical protein
MIPYIWMAIGIVLIFASIRIRPPFRILGMLLGVFCCVGSCIIPPSNYHEITMRNACINNLRIIRDAKEDYTLRNNQTTNSPTPEQISSFMKHGFEHLKCPKGGTYSINSVGTEPRCSFHGTIGEMLPETKIAQPTSPGDVADAPPEKADVGQDGMN